MAKMTQKETSFRRALAEQFLTLATSGFGLVAALAWNEAIQSFVKDYIQKYYPDQSGFFSKLFYAALITIFAVIVTYHLSRLASRWGVKR